MSIPPTPVPPNFPAAAALPPQQLSYAAPGVEAVVLTPRALEMLRRTRPWVAFIGTVLAVIGVLVTAGSVVTAVVLVVQQQPAQGIAFLLYVIVGLIYLYPGIYLRRYARGIRDLVNLRASEHLEAAMAAQKDFWRLVGVLMAIILGLYAVIIVLAVAGLGFAGLMR